MGTGDYSFGIIIDPGASITNTSTGNFILNGTAVATGTAEAYGIYIQTDGSIKNTNTSSGNFILYGMATAADTARDTSVDASGIFIRGTITNDGITDDCYWLDIKNDCSNNLKRFCFDYSDWLTAYVGTDVCLNGEEPW